MRTITLTEYRDHWCELDHEDARYIQQHLRNRIAIGRDATSGAYILNPMQHVGVVILPSQTRIECQPKVSIAHLFRMLAVAYNVDAEFYREIDRFDDLDDLFEFVVSYFATLVEARIAHGLYRSYVEREENLSTVRGRISLAEDMRRNHVLRHRVYCRYSDFTWDIPENQIIRQTVHLVRGWVRKDRTLRHRLLQIDHQMAEVAPTRLPAGAIDRFSYHRLNDDYEPIHRLCRLFLEGASLSERRGEFNFQTFLIDMNVLFEQFVTAVLAHHGPPGCRLERQYPASLDAAGRVSIRPDLAVFHQGRLTLLADCKYKRLSGEDVHHHDLYQMLAYCTAEGIERGVLIYPQHEQVPGRVHEVRHSPITIRQVSVDLDASDRAFDEMCALFADRVYRMAAPTPDIGPGFEELSRVAAAALN